MKTKTINQVSIERLTLFLPILFSSLRPARAHLWGFHEAVGYLLFQGLIDVETVYNILGSYQTLTTWNFFKDIILEQRKFYDNPHWYRWMEYLASEISKEMVRQGLPPEISDADGIITRK